MTELSPMTTPLRIMQRAPIHTSWPILTGLVIGRGLSSGAYSIRWKSVSIISQFQAIKHRSPISTCCATLMIVCGPIAERCPTRKYAGVPSGACTATWQPRSNFAKRPTEMRPLPRRREAPRSKIGQCASLKRLLRILPIKSPTRSRFLFPAGCCKNRRIMPRKVVGIGTGEEAPGSSPSVRSSCCTVFPFTTLNIHVTTLRSNLRLIKPQRHYFTAGTTWTQDIHLLGLP